MERNRLPNPSLMSNGCLASLSASQSFSTSVIPEWIDVFDETLQFATVRCRYILQSHSHAVNHKVRYIANNTFIAGVFVTALISTVAARRRRQLL